MPGLQLQYHAELCFKVSSDGSQPVENRLLCDCSLIERKQKLHALFDSFKEKTSEANVAKLPPVPKKPPRRAVPVPRKTTRKSCKAR